MRFATSHRCLAGANVVAVILLTSGCFETLKPVDEGGADCAIVRRGKFR